MDFIARKSEIVLETSESVVTNSLISHTFTPAFVDTHVPKTILANANTRLQNVLYPSMYTPSVHDIKTVQSILETALPVLNLLVTGHAVLHPVADFTETNEQKFNIIPSRASKFRTEIDHSNKFSRDSNLSLNNSSKFPKIAGNLVSIRAQKGEDANINDDMNAVKPNLHPDNFLSNMIANEFEIRNINIDKKVLRQTDIISNEILVINRKLDNEENNDHMPQSRQVTSTSAVNNDKQNKVQVMDGNREKVLTIFTDVFVILGTEAQTDKQVIENTEASQLSSKTVSGIYSTDTQFQSESDNVQYSVMESIVNMPQPSFTNIADNLFRRVQMSRTAATDSSVHITDDSVIVPAEITPPSLLNEPIKYSAVIEKNIADPGRMLSKKRNVIVIHTNRNLIQNNENGQLRHQQPNNKDNIIPTDHHKTIVQPVHQLPELNEISETPELFEMQEIRFPRVSTNRTSDINWFNVLNVPSGNEESRANNVLNVPSGNEESRANNVLNVPSGNEESRANNVLNVPSGNEESRANNVLNVPSDNKESRANNVLPKPATMKSQVELEGHEGRQAITFDEALPLDAQMDADLTDLVTHSNDNSKKQKVLVHLPVGINDPVQENNHLEKLSTGNLDVLRNPVVKGSQQGMQNSNNLEPQQNKIISQNVSPKQFPDRINKFISKDHHGKESFIHVITRPGPILNKAHSVLEANNKIKLVSSKTNEFVDGITIPNNNRVEQATHPSNSFVAKGPIPFDSMRNAFQVNSIDKNKINPLKNFKFKENEQVGLLREETDPDAVNTIRGRNEANAVFRNVSFGMQTLLHGVPGENVAIEQFRSQNQRHVIRRQDQTVGIRKHSIRFQPAPQEDNFGQDTIGLNMQVGGNTKDLNNEFQNSHRKTFPACKRSNLFRNAKILEKSRPINTGNQNYGIPTPAQGIRPAKIQSNIVGRNIETLSNGIPGHNYQNQRISTVVGEVPAENALHGTLLGKFRKHKNVNINNGFPFSSENQQATILQNNFGENMAAPVTHRHANTNSYIPSAIFDGASSVPDSLPRFTVPTSNTDTDLQRNQRGLIFPNTFVQNTYPMQRANTLYTPVDRRRNTNVPFRDQRNKRGPVGIPERNDRIYTAYTGGYYVQPWSFLTKNGIEPAGETATFSNNDNLIYKPVLVEKRRNLRTMDNKYTSHDRMPIFNSRYKSYHRRRMKNKPKWRWTSGKQLSPNQLPNYLFSNIRQIKSYAFYGNYRRYRTFSYQYFNKWCKFVNII